jgi:hypothetical protein
MGAMTIKENEMSMEVKPTSCWFCGRPILTGERANRAPHGGIAVHTDCLRDDAVSEGIRPSEEPLRLRRPA